MEGGRKERKERKQEIDEGWHQGRKKAGKRKEERMGGREGSKEKKRMDGWMGGGRN